MKKTKTNKKKFEKKVIIIDWILFNDRTRNNIHQQIEFIIYIINDLIVRHVHLYFNLILYMNIEFKLKYLFVKELDEIKSNTT